LKASSEGFVVTLDRQGRFDYGLVAAKDSGSKKIRIMVLTAGGKMCLFNSSFLGGIRGKLKKLTKKRVDAL
jgi:hypothetical protein